MLRLNKSVSNNGRQLPQKKPRSDDGLRMMLESEQKASRPGRRLLPKKHGSGRKPSPFVTSPRRNTEAEES